jgi:hypothetical protein
MPEQKIKKKELLIDAGSGMSVYAMAKKYHVYPGSVGQRLKKLGFPRRHFTNEKEWKKMTNSGFNVRHLAIKGKTISKLGFNKDDVLLYREIIIDGKLIIDIKKEEK